MLCCTIHNLLRSLSCWCKRKLDRICMYSSKQESTISAVVLHLKPCSQTRSLACFHGCRRCFRWRGTSCRGRFHCCGGPPPHPPFRTTPLSDRSHTPYLSQISDLCQMSYPCHIGRTQEAQRTSSMSSNSPWTVPATRLASCREVPGAARWRSARAFDQKQHQYYPVLACPVLYSGLGFRFWGIHENL